MDSENSKASLNFLLKRFMKFTFYMNIKINQQNSST